MPTTTAQTWPALDELRAPVENEIAEVLDKLELLSKRLNRLVDIDVAPSVRDDAPRPTLADVGALSWFVSRADLYLGATQDHVDEIRRVRDAIAFECEEVESV